MPEAYNPPVATAGIYRIVHRESGKSYIGSTNDFQRRHRVHRTDIEGGRHRNAHLTRAVNLYGWDAFDFVIEEHTNADGAYLLEREQVYLDAAALDKRAFYNVCWTAGSGPGVSGDAHWSKKYPERYNRGEDHWTHRHPEKVPRGETSGARMHSERMARGDANGSRLHPERLSRGENHYSKTHPEKMSRGEKHRESMKGKVPTGDRRGSRTHPERQPRGEKVGGAKLTEDKVREIRRLYTVGDVTQQQLANVFGVSQAVIGDAIRRVTWAHVP